MSFIYAVGLVFHDYLTILVWGIVITSYRKVKKQSCFLHFYVFKIQFHCLIVLHLHSPSERDVLKAYCDVTFTGFPMRPQTIFLYGRCGPSDIWGSLYLKVQCYSVKHKYNCTAFWALYFTYEHWIMCENANWRSPFWTFWLSCCSCTLIFQFFAFGNNAFILSSNH